ncbi:MAG: hypothetical protein ACRD2W_24540, partial [Acidimicrobiales bacterium]
MKRVGLLAVVVAVGLGMGLGTVRAFSGWGSTAGEDHVPSVKQFSFPTSVAEGAEPAAPEPEQASPITASTPEAALAAVLRAEQERTPELGWALLDAGARARYPTPASWARARSGRPTPLRFEIVGAAAVPDRA